MVLPQLPRRLATDTVDFYRGWLDASLNAGQRWKRVADTWVTEALSNEGALRRSVQRAVEETWASLTAQDVTQNTPAYFARMLDLARSNTFLWYEANLTTGEALSRVARNAGSRLPLGPQWLPRVLVISTVAADVYTGYIALRNRARVSPRLVSAQDWELQHQRGAARVRDTAASLGGVLIKGAQFASTRPDLLPRAYLTTLAPLQDRVPPQPWMVTAETIRNELGRPIGEVFAQIDSRPIASASIAQVHRARLRDGREVAVKVQYADIAERVTVDLAALERIAQTVQLVEPQVRLQPILDYLNGTLPLELDFRREAAAIKGLRQALADRDDVLIPDVIEEVSTDKLLVLEFVEGIKITAVDALEAAGIDPKAVARRLNEIYAAQIFGHGHLHGDPHPGNLFVQPGPNGPRLVLLDHGLSEPLPPALVEALRDMVRALTAGDFDLLGDALNRAGFKLDGKINITDLLQLVGVIMGGELPSGAGQLGQELATSIGAIPVDLILVGRALSLLDGITRQLDPDLDVLAIVLEYANAAPDSQQKGLAKEKKAS